MITRTAIFEGVFHDGNDKRFFAGVEGRLAPLWRQFPHALSVRWFPVTSADAESRPIVMIQQIDYPSHEALALAIASPIRDQARAVTMELMQLLEGTFYHFVTDGGAR